MKLKDYLPLKAVVEDLGVSRWTLWRAAASNIPDFPAPTRVGRQVFWKKSEMEVLEAALMRFQGRCAFDRQRQHAKKVRALTRAKAKANESNPVSAAKQQDLFT
jgi:predicted DNA-binding transcriptional regulator AlpA